MDIWTAEKIILLGFLLKGVSCGGFSVNMPENITALSGSCVAIKCDFNIEDKYDEYLTEVATTGLWFKDGMDANINQVFNSRVSKSNRFSGKTTGKLHEKNCTTIFYNVSSNHNGKYYFRIMSGEDLKYTYPQPFSTVNVIEFPPKPTVQLYVEQKEVQDQEEVLEESSVSLRCSAETLCSSPPPTLTWSSTPRIPLSESSRLQELILISDLNFTATHRQHGVTFICTITYQLQDENKTAQNSITLQIQYSPKNTSVSVIPSDSVLESSSVTLTCSSDANPAVVIYTWSRESGGQLEQLQTGDTLTFNRVDLKHEGWYHCTAQNQHGSQNSSVMLDIQYAPKISPSPGCYKTVCFCEIDGNPSPKLEWHLSGRPVTNSSNTFISEERLSSTGLRSSITLHQSLTNTSTLRCVSNNIHGNASQLFHLLHVTPQESGVVDEEPHNPTVPTPSECFHVPTVMSGIAHEDASEPIYANNATLSPTRSATQKRKEPLYYASIDFTNMQPESDEIRGISSLTKDYAEVRCYPDEVSETESSVGGVQPKSSISAEMESEENQTILDQEAESREVFSQPSEDTTYESITI
ncbi:sialic acid-binding Ig-like lectin 13 [Garra rufa]|uniref:sialic acid-binding Ig-like lectin 13 n=1 Tax=Garra rufa TaxID=137080 RepID=UPI003CCE73D4